MSKDNLVIVLGDAGCGEKDTKAAVYFNSIVVPGVVSVDVHACANEMTTVTLEIHAKDCEIYQRFVEINKDSAYYCTIE